MQKICSVAIDRDGDVGVLFVRYNGLKLQIVESHRVGDYLEDDSGFADGVKTNKFGMPLEYLVADESIYGEFFPQSVKAKRVPANAMSWLLDPERAEQQKATASNKTRH